MAEQRLHVAQVAAAAQQTGRAGVAERMKRQPDAEAAAVRRSLRPLPLRARSSPARRSRSVTSVRVNDVPPNVAI